MKYRNPTHGQTARCRPSMRRRMISLLALPAVLLSIFVVGAEAKPKWASAEGEDPAADPRCDAPPIQIDAQSETTINPLGGTRIVLTRADCREGSESRTEPTESSFNRTVSITIESGEQEFVAFVGKFVDDRASEGSTTTTGASKSIQQMELHLPILPADRICVTFDDQRICLPSEQDDEE